MGTWGNPELILPFFVCSLERVPEPRVCQELFDSLDWEPSGLPEASFQTRCITFYNKSTRNLSTTLHRPRPSTGHLRRSRRPGVYTPNSSWDSVKCQVSKRPRIPGGVLVDQNESQGSFGVDKGWRVCGVATSLPMSVRNTT